MASDDEHWIAGADGYISDDSSFYGDEDLRDHLTTLSTSFSPQTYWSTHHTSLSSIAASALLARSTEKGKSPSLELYNPYDGLLSARQLSETVSEFLNRLPALTTQCSEIGSWIWIANLYSERRPLQEDLAALTTKGKALLEGFLERKRAVEGEMEGRPKATVRRRLGAERKALEEGLVDVAVETGCTSGKWMLFPMPPHVPRIWSLIAHAVSTNDLGIAAKVATDEGKGDRLPRLICVYTKDFNDVKDVRRVVRKLVDMGVVERGMSVYYKCDAYTHLGISSGNEYGLKASLYASKDVLAKD
ncbi:MAG: hypothetical protein M1827_001627 [Pycnora praestabilis]|nr:MAG: hypothetical protein M1827_001627 [Pycnora praestabilis]